MPDPKTAPLVTSGGLEPLRRRDPALAALLFATALLLAWSWMRQEGYQLADSVEYLERAQGLARGQELIDSQAIRSFGFSGLLIPLYWIYDALGLREPVRIMQAAQLLQVMLTLALVFVTARTCASWIGRSGGLCAGVLLAFNPIVLRWGVEPVSGIASALFVVLAISRAIAHRGPLFEKHGARAAEVEPTLRDAWICGALLGLAFLMAYQSILVLGAILLVLFARDLRRRVRWPLCALAALSLVVLVQCALDALYYGRFGISVWTHFTENFGSQAALLIYKFHALPWVGPYFEDASRALYNSIYAPDAHTIVYQDKVIAGEEDVARRLPQTWYLTNLTRCLVLPTAILVGIGLLRAFAGAFSKSAILWLVVGLNVLVMSMKGSKDFRLWLPFLPLLAMLGGIGLSLILARGRAGRATAIVALCAALVLAIVEFRATNTRKFSGFWRALALVNQHAAARPAPSDASAEPLPRLRVSAAYHWSMFLRESRDVEQVKLPHHLDGWQKYPPEYRAADFATLATLDAFITHLPVLTENPDLFEVINRDFAVLGAFYDRVVYDSLGPIYVLERRAQSEGGLRFFEREVGRTREEALRLAGGGALLGFEGLQDGARQSLALLEAKYTPLAGDGHGWISYVWHGGPLAAPDWSILDRLTAPDHENSWQNNHRPAYGMAPTSAWEADTLVREGYLVVAEADPFRPDEVYRDLGGAYRRGDLLPLSLWIDVVRLDEAGLVAERLPAVDPRTGERVDDVAPSSDLSSPSGATTSADGMTRACSLFVPVPPAARLRDDGGSVANVRPR